MYVHLTARALPGTLLFHDWTEALDLWRRLRAAFPEARAMCLMPNHPHVIADAERARVRMSGVMSGYARWRGRRRRQAARCWQAQPEPEPLPDADHLRRTVRYVHLNPCRGGLVSDPLAWPLSTHRDQVGLGDVRLRVRDPHRQHAYVSADPSVSVVGTDLPAMVIGSAPLRELETAVGAVLRQQPEEVRRSPSGRRLLVRAAWLSGHQDTQAMAEHLGVARSAVYKMIQGRPAISRLDREPILAAVLRAVGDPRMGPLVATPRADLTRWAGWKMEGHRPTYGGAQGNGR